MQTPDPVSVLTIGHSNHSYERFLALLRSAAVTAIADVRSVPFSRHFPQFNATALKQQLRSDGIAYSFLGEALGGRPRAAALFENGVADYEAMSKLPGYTAGLARVLEGARGYRIALMCSEQDPADCHRCLLIARSLHGAGVRTRHLLHDGTAVDHAVLEKRLLKLAGRDAEDMFLSREARLAIAYRDRARRVGYAVPEQPVAAE